MAQQPQWPNRFAHCTYKQYKCLKDAEVVSSSLTWGKSLLLQAQNNNIQLRFLSTVQWLKKHQILIQNSKATYFKDGQYSLVSQQLDFHRCQSFVFMQNQLSINLYNWRVLASIKFGCWTKILLTKEYQKYYDTKLRNKTIFDPWTISNSLLFAQIYGFICYSVLIS